jgi:hypothetical protein
VLQLKKGLIIGFYLILVKQKKIIGNYRKPTKEVDLTPEVVMVVEVVLDDFYPHVKVVVVPD